MRFMLLVKASQESEAGLLPDERLRSEIWRFNQTLMRAGVLLAADGLQASSSGARVRFADGRPSVSEGPFPEGSQLVAGYWLVQVKSKAEAVEWAKRAPFAGGEIEVRQVLELTDFVAPGA
jgi:hypothetical protein